MICTFGAPHAINDFVSRLGEVPEIAEYDISNIISVAKEQQRALVETNVSLVLQCAYCKKEIRDDPLRLRGDEKDYYLCCSTCLKSFQGKYERLKAKT